MVYGERARWRREKEVNIADEEEIPTLLPLAWTKPE